MIHDQTQAFLDENIILFRFQSGFRKTFSIDLFLSYLSNKVATGFDSGVYTGMILIDLQKEFDMINHEIFTNKLEYSGFPKDVILWFKPYLSNLKFKVNFKQNFFRTWKSFIWSSSRIFFRATPLFPLCKWHAPCSSMWTSFICRWYLSNFQPNDIKEIEIQLDKNFSLICDWFMDNELSTHFDEDKIRSILFSSKRKIKKAGPLNTQYKDIKINQFTEVKYLGCIYHQTLSR